MSGPASPVPRRPWGRAALPLRPAGETFGVNYMALDVPAGYISGGLLSGSSTFDNTTIASLGFTPGTYVFSWNSSVDSYVVGPAADDSITIQVGSAVPEPSTWAMMLIGFAGLGFAGYRASLKAASIAA
jgi:hypothetical protein